MTIRQRISTFLADLQQTFFPALAAVVPDPVTEAHERLVAILELVDVDQRRRFGARTAVERFNSRLKDDCGARVIRVRGEAKVHAFLMCGLLVIFAEALLTLGGG